MYLEAPGIPMLLRKSEIPPERRSMRYQGGPKPGQERFELSTSHQAPLSYPLSSCRGLPPSTARFPHQSSETTESLWEPACNALLCRQQPSTDGLRRGKYEGPEKMRLSF